MIESLERRRLLSFSTVFGHLMVRGTSGDDVISIDEGDGGLTITINGERERVDSDFEVIDVRSVGGDDRITNNTDRRSSLNGGAGNDTLVGGSGHDTLVGSDGDDRLDGRGGDDDLRGERGNDLSDGGSGNDSVFEVNGLNTINGGSGNDTLVGGGGRDRIAGNDGDDQVAGQGGNDFLDGSGGNDSLFGADGNDVFRGGSGMDMVSYDGHPAAVNASIDGVANDGRVGESDNVRTDVEVLIGSAGNDTLVGSNGADHIEGNGGTDSIGGGGGNDTLLGGDDPQTTSPFAPDDTLDGGAGSDLLEGQLGADSLIGGTGQDTLLGQEGDDTGVYDVEDSIELGPGDFDVVFLRGTSGRDVVTFRHRSLPGQVALVVETNHGTTEVPVQAEVITYEAGAGDDYVTITDQASVYWMVRLFGEDGNDYLRGGTGDDALNGGNGNDTLDGNPGDDALNGGPGNDKIIPGGGANTIFARDSRKDYIYKPSSLDQVDRDDFDAILS